MGSVCTIWGNLTDGVKKSLSKSKTEYAVFSVASTRSYKDRAGNKIVDFIRCVAYGNVADYLSKYSKKGDKVQLVGEWCNSTYEDDKGVTRTSTTLDLRNGRAEILSHAQNTGQHLQSFTDGDGEIPF